MWTDDAGNLIGYIGTDDKAGTAQARDHRQRTSSISGGTATRVMAHVDELSMLVKRVEADGTLHMTQLGVMYPGNFGLGPVEPTDLGDQTRSGRPRAPPKTSPPPACTSGRGCASTAASEISSSSAVTSAPTLWMIVPR
jgi:hypothetical protein